MWGVRHADDRRPAPRPRGASGRAPLRSGQASRTRRQAPLWPGRVRAHGRSPRRRPASEMLLVVSGRAGYEIVQKSVGAGIPLLAAVGAPSSLAVALAREFNQTLVGFLRGDRFNVYSGAERLTKG